MQWAFSGPAVAPKLVCAAGTIAVAALLAGCVGGNVVSGGSTPSAGPGPHGQAAADAAPPFVEPVIEIGRSREVRPILLHRFGFGERPVLVLGGIHGSEGNSADCARRLVSYLRYHPMEAANTPLAVIPEANPDGLEVGVRFNAKRVDLNRNFPAANWVKGYASGPAPASEPETQAIVQIIRDLRPRRILSIHSIAGEPCNNYDGPAEQLARAMASANGYAVKGWIGYPTPGSLGSWAGADLGIPVVTLELPASTTGAEAWERNRSAILQFIRGP